MTSRSSLLLLFLLLLGSSAGEAVSEHPTCNLTASGVACQTSSEGNMTGPTSQLICDTKYQLGVTTGLTGHTDTETTRPSMTTPSTYAGRHAKQATTTPSPQTDADVAHASSGIVTFTSCLFFAIDITLGVVAVKRLVQDIWIDYGERNYWLAFFGSLGVSSKSNKVVKNIISFLSEIRIANAADPQGSYPHRLHDTDASISPRAPHQQGDAFLTTSFAALPTSTPAQAVENVSFVLQKWPSSLP